MPLTAKEAAAQAHVAIASKTDLLDPKINAAIAVEHFGRLVAHFDGQPIWSLCAYNAGAGKCKGWREKLKHLPPLLQIEAIPYDETRIYVERIFAGWALTAPIDSSRVKLLATGLGEASAKTLRAAKPKK
jgi:soluble lytic murein transglycosylase